VGGAVYMNAGCHGRTTSHHLVSVGYVDRRGCFMTLSCEQLTFGDRYSSFHEMDGVIVSAMFQLVPDDQAKDRQREWIHYRLKEHPVQERSGGCVFRNFPDISAGALIDRCGLKGARRGDAQVATQHANFIINRGRATSKDVLDLIDKICQVVRTKSQRELTLELCVAPY